VAGHPTRGKLFRTEELAFQSALGPPREFAKLALEFGWVKGYLEVTFDAVARDLKRQQNLARA